MFDLMIDLAIDTNDSKNQPNLCYHLHCFLCMEHHDFHNLPMPCISCSTAYYAWRDDEIADMYYNSSGNTNW